jgi:hypothetical protein
MIESNAPTPMAAANPSAPHQAHRAHRALKRLPFDAYGLWALILIAAGVLIRLGLLLLDWPGTDSDEGTMGLMALHIAGRGDFPFFFYGQTYMGALQAYLGAVFFTLFGSSVFTLRLGLLLLFTLFLVTMYLLLRLLYTPPFALVALALLDLGGPELLKPQLLGLGGYPETLLFGALGLLLATWLALGARADARRQPRWLRLAAYAGFGLTLGLGWWSDPLVLPFIVAAALLLGVFCYRDLRWGGLAIVALGLVVGLLPQITYTIQHTADTGPTAVAAFQPQGVGTLAQLPASLAAQLFGATLINFPDIAGPGWLCAVSTDHGGMPLAWHDAGVLGCAGLRVGWSIGALTLGVIAAVASLRAVRALRTATSTGAGVHWVWSLAEYHTVVTHAGRLALLLGGGLATVMYSISPSAIPPGHTRYLIGMLIALPAMIYPLWFAGIERWSGFRASHRSWMRRISVSWVCLGLIFLALGGGVVSTYVLAPAARAQYGADQSLIRDLDRLGVRHMYTDYWTCYKVAFLTRERMTCDVLNKSLGQGNNRYVPYVAEVQADPRAAYVFPAKSPQAAAFARQMDAPGWHFVRVRLNGYVVYLSS